VILKSKPALRSGVLAKAVGISPDTLRLYERQGLIQCPPRSAAGYRCYPPEAVDRMRLIRAALSVGFTLHELGEILTIRDGGGFPCGRVRELAAIKLRNLERHVRELGELRRQLKTMLQQWDRTLKRTAPNKGAGLLERLAAESRSNRRKLDPRLYASLAGKSIHKERKR
jgi:DNA-binding transcriptional MerR regulator